MQTAFPAKVVGWNASTNVVELEPQFIETWVNRDGTRQSEPQDFPNIQNVPVLFPRSGSWSITFPIETGSYGLVVCTKYALDVWREQGQVRDPGDLRRFGMSGAVFHPVNLHPNGSTLKSPGDFTSTLMELGDDGTKQFIALANLVTTELVSIRTAINTHVHADPVSGNTGTASVGYRTASPPTEQDIRSATVKVSE